MRVCVFAKCMNFKLFIGREQLNWSEPGWGEWVGGVGRGCGGLGLLQMHRAEPPL